MLTEPQSRSTGKERDNETGLDYFGARFYGSNIGRGVSPDWTTAPTPVPHSDLTDPQTLNLYVYVRNNPLYRTDFDGHDWNDVRSFFLGAANAYSSDNFAGIGRQEQTTRAGEVGAAVGDTVATIQGAGEVLFGGGLEVGGVAADATGAGAVVGVPANLAGAAVIAHGGSTAAAGFSNLFSKATKNGGANTEPTLPQKTVASGDGVTLKHFTKSGDHGPAHLHVEGNGPNTRIGMNGKPLKGDAELSSAQQGVVNNNKGTIRSAVDKIQRWFKFNKD